MQMEICWVWDSKKHVYLSGFLALSKPNKMKGALCEYAVETGLARDYPIRHRLLSDSRPTCRKGGSPNTRGGGLNARRLTDICFVKQAYGACVTLWRPNTLGCPEATGSARSYS